MRKIKINMKKLVLLILLVALGGVAWGLMQLYPKLGLAPERGLGVRPQSGARVTPAAAGKVMVTARLVSPTQGESNYKLTLGLLPQTGNIDISAFDLRVKAIPSGEGNRVKVNGAAIVDKSLLNSDFSFPIRRTVAEKNGVVVELSGIYVSKESFVLASEQPLVTVPIEISSGTKFLVVTVDTQTSRMLTKNLGRLELTQPTQKIAVKD